MKTERYGAFELDSVQSAVAPECGQDELTYRGLRCACGSRVFRLTGWPRIVSGRGGFFWRSFSRVWREARLPMQNGEPVDSPFRLPIAAYCAECGREETLFDDARLADRLGLDERDHPRESYRCRICRRGLVNLSVGAVGAAGAVEPVAAIRAGDDEAGEEFEPLASVELVARCHRCQRQARVAWSEGQRSSQESRLDLLYGRR